jgi:hypothetical protein
MFKKKPEAPKVEAAPVAPQEVEEISTEEEETAEEVESEGESAEQPELSTEQLKQVLEKLIADVNAIKYHLRLDFI